MEQRYSAARSTVQQVRADHPGESADDLANRLIRLCARDLAVGGAMSGGAAASPVAGVTVAAASLGAEASYGVGRLGEMVMAIGIVHGFEHATAKERAAWVAAVLGVSEGAAMGLTGVAARAGATGGARLLRRLPTGASAGGSSTRRFAARVSGKGGPWSLAALIPYGIGAGVGAAGNAALAYSVGRASKRYFATHLAPGPGRPPPGPGPSPADDSGGGDSGDDDIWDAEVLEERILDPEDGPA